MGNRRAMIAYPDTSFLCSRYREQVFSEQARQHRDRMREALYATVLLEFEFMQAIELQVFLHLNDRTKGYGRRVADAVIAKWNEQIAEGKVKLVPCDTDEVIRYALKLSRSHTAGGGIDRSTCCTSPPRCTSGRRSFSASTIAR